MHHTRRIEGVTFVPGKHPTLGIMQGRPHPVGGEGAVMTTTLSNMTAKKKPEPSAEEVAARELVRLAKEQGLSLTGPDGLLKQFTKSVLETALNEEMTEHLGHQKNRAAGGQGVDQHPERDPAEDGPDPCHR